MTINSGVLSDISSLLWSGPLGTRQLRTRWRRAAPCALHRRAPPSCFHSLVEFRRRAPPSCLKSLPIMSNRSLRDLKKLDPQYASSNTVLRPKISTNNSRALQSPPFPTTRLRSRVIRHQEVRDLRVSSLALTR